MSLLDALREAGEWARSVRSQGMDLPKEAHRKLLHEAFEFAQEPSLEELADVVICLVGSSVHHGWSIGDVTQAIVEKVAVNWERTWSQMEDRTWRHV